MLRLPKFLMHERETLSKNPLTGQRRKAWNAFPFGVWYTKRTSVFTLQQEIAEYLLTGIVVVPTAATITILFRTLGLTPWMILALTPALIYPGAFFIRWPGSHYVRRFIELRTHALEGRARLSSHTTIEMLGWINMRSDMMARNRFYGLKMGVREIESELIDLIFAD